VNFYQDQECTLSNDFIPPANVNIECDFLPYESYPGIVVVGVACFSAVTGFIFLGWIIWRRNHPVMKPSQPFFMCLISLGGLICGSSPIISLGPGTSEKCQALPWLFHCSFTLMIGSLFVKTFRVWRIFGNKTLMNVKVTVWDSLRLLATILGIVVLVLGLWYILDAPYRINVKAVVAGVGTVDMTSCKSKSIVFRSVLIFFEVVVVALACYFSFKNRNVPGNFSETQYVMISVYSVAIVLGISHLVAIQNVSTSLQVALTGVGTSLSCSISLFVLFLPKMLLYYRNSEDEILSRISNVPISQQACTQRRALSLSSRELTERYKHILCLVDEAEFEQDRKNEITAQLNQFASLINSRLDQGDKIKIDNGTTIF